MMKSNRKSRVASVALLFLAALASGNESTQLVSEAQTSRSLSAMLKAKAALSQEHQQRKELYKLFGLPTDKASLGLKPDFFDAQIYEIQRAGYPNDSIDPGMYVAGMAHVNGMRSTRNPFEDVERVSDWYFRGPNNLDVPYTQYWGPRPVSGRVNAVLYDWGDPNSDYFIATAGGGVWRTTNGGVDWTPLSDKWDTLAVSCLAMHPTNNEIIFAGTGDLPRRTAGFGIMKTTDDGNSWVKVNGPLSSGCAISKILIDPEQPNTMIATASSGTSRGVYRSTDGGNNWVQLTGIAGIPGGSYIGASMSGPNTSGNRRYWVISEGTPARLFTSTNRGASWTEVVTPVTPAVFSTADITASPNKADTAYLLINNERRIQKTTDGGATWASIKGNFPNGDSNYNWSQQGYDWHINATKRTGTSTSDALYVGLIDLAVSLNGDSTWRSIGGPTYDTFGAKTHNDQHCLTPNPSDPTEFLAGNDGGVYKVRINRSTGEATYTNLNRNLAVTQIYYGSWALNNRDRILTGAQDNATPASADDLSNWKAPVGGDGTGVSILQQNPDRQYATNQNLGQNNEKTEIGIYLTQHNWALIPRKVSTSVLSSEVSNGHIPFVGPIATSEESDHAYIGTNRLYRWEDNFFGGGWNARLGGNQFCTASNTFITAISVPKGKNKIYVGTLDGRLWRSTLAGQIWFEVVTVGLPNRPITAISSSPNNSNSVIVTLGGAAGQARVWKNGDVTSSTSPWQIVAGQGSDALPDVPTNCILRDLNTPDSTWFVGTDLGVFFTNDAGFTYFDMTRPMGLPNTRVTSLGWNTVSGNLRLNCSTFGRGVWRMSVQNGDPIIGEVTAPSALVGGEERLGFVTFSAPAPTGGTLVQFTSSNPAALSVPASVNVAAGVTGCFFRLRTTPVTSNTIVTVDINAAGDQREIAVLVKNTMIAELKILTPDLEGKKGLQARVALIGPAPANGYQLQVGYESDLGDKLQTLVFKPGETSKTFELSLPVVQKKTEAKLIARWRNMQEVTQIFTIPPHP